MNRRGARRWTGVASGYDARTELGGCRQKDAQGVQGCEVPETGREMWKYCSGLNGKARNYSNERGRLRITKANRAEAMRKNLGLRGFF